MTNTFPVPVAAIIDTYDHETGTWRLNAGIVDVIGVWPDGNGPVYDVTPPAFVRTILAKHDDQVTDAEALTAGETWINEWRAAIETCGQDYALLLAYANERGRGVKFADTIVNLIETGHRDAELLGGVL